MKYHPFLFYFYYKSPSLPSLPLPKIVFPHNQSPCASAEWCESQEKLHLIFFLIWRTSLGIFLFRRLSGFPSPVSTHSASRLSFPLLPLCLCVFGGGVSCQTDPGILCVSTEYSEDSVRRERPAHWSYCKPASHPHSVLGEQRWICSHDWKDKSRVFFFFFFPLSTQSTSQWNTVTSGVSFSRRYSSRPWLASRDSMYFHFVPSQCLYRIFLAHGNILQHIPPLLL